MNTFVDLVLIVTIVGLVFTLLGVICDGTWAAVDWWRGRRDRW